MGNIYEIGFKRKIKSSLNPIVASYRTNHEPVNDYSYDLLLFFELIQRFAMILLFVLSSLANKISHNLLFFISIHNIAHWL
jgi:hypothetical protein